MTDDVELWQRTLAVEHAVIWSYGLVGATSGLAEPAEAALSVHRSRRTDCIEAIVDLGGEPVASAPSYDVDKPPSTSAARQLATDFEDSASAAYASLAGAADRRSRLRAAQWLRVSAIMQTQWSGRVPALPGLETDPAS